MSEHFACFFTLFFNYLLLLLLAIILLLLLAAVTYNQVQPYQINLLKQNNCNAAYIYMHTMYGYIVQTKVSDTKS